MSDVWYKDPKTGDIYQDRKEKGKLIRYFRDDPRESTATRAEPSSSRRDQASHRTRRGSVISSTSADFTTDKSQTQRGTSSRRDASIREEDNGRGGDRSQAAYVSYDRTQGQQEPSSTYGNVQTHGTSSDGKKTYHQPGGYNTSQEYGAEDLADGMRGLDISTGDNYTLQSMPSSIPAETGYSVSQAPYTPIPLDSTPAGYRQPYNTSSALPAAQPTLQSRHVAGTPDNGDTEKLDRSYQIRNHDYKKFFKIGRVFSTLWTEGLGSNIDKVDPTFVSEVVYKERVHSKVRRFVVVREGDRAVTCLPVTSYDGAGHKKHGIHLEDHGFIHSKNTPRKVDGMLSKSLKVVLSRGAAHIKDPSLVNYGKVYTVETNVKVKDIGDLDTDSKALLVRYFHKVFIGESDLRHGVDDTPRQSNAILAGVGGAAYGQPLNSTSSYNTAAAAASYPLTIPYSQPIGSNMNSGYPADPYSTHNPTGYSSTPDNQSQRFDPRAYHSPSGESGYNVGSEAQSSGYSTMQGAQNRGSDFGGNYQPIATGPGYLPLSATSGYPSAQGYGSAAGGVGYNTTPAYYPSSSSYPPSDNQYRSMASGSASTVPYTVSYTPRTAAPLPYSSAPPGNYYQQPGGGQGPASGSYTTGESYAGYQTSNNPQSSYQNSPIAEDEDINLPTLEIAQQEQRRRRESKPGPSSSDRRRRR